LAANGGLALGLILKNPRTEDGWGVGPGGLLLSAIAAVGLVQCLLDLSLMIAFSTPKALTFELSILWLYSLMSHS
jgi:hypothetical protein